MRRKPSCPSSAPSDAADPASAAWTAAGLTDADVPTTWEELASIAQRLTTPERKGLVLDDSADRVVAFMKQAGGWHVDEKGMPTIDSPQNLRALRYLQSLLQSGSTAFSSAVDAGWAGEALGEGTAAMVIEGTWVSGALASDYPDRRWRAVELPAGPAGKATLSFTNCWGIPMRTPYRQQAQDLVDFLMAREQQEQVAREVGVIPANQEALPALTEGRPEMEGFAAGAAYAQGEVTTKGWDSVEKDFDSRMLGLAQGEVTCQRVSPACGTRLSQPLPRKLNRKATGTPPARRPLASSGATNPAPPVSAGPRPGLSATARLPTVTDGGAPNRPRGSDTPKRTGTRLRKAGSLSSSPAK